MLELLLFIIIYIHIYYSRSHPIVPLDMIGGFERSHPINARRLQIARHALGNVKNVDLVFGKIPVFFDV